MRDNTGIMARTAAESTTEKKGVTIRLWPPTGVGLYVVLLIASHQLDVWTGQPLSEWVDRIFRWAGV